MELLHLIHQKQSFAVGNANVGIQNKDDWKYRLMFPKEIKSSFKKYLLPPILGNTQILFQVHHTNYYFSISCISLALAFFR